MKKRFKVASDTSGRFSGVELDYVLDDDSIGRTLKLFGEDYRLTQNGPILVLVNEDCCMTLQDITPEVVEEPKKLVINDTLEIYLRTKEVAVKAKCTYQELYEVLQDEWKLLGRVISDPMPFEYDNALQLFTFLNGWSFEHGDFSMLSEGSYARKSADGRNI